MRFGKNDENDVIRFPDCRGIHETPRALLVSVDGDDKWFPKSVIHDDSEVYAPGDEGELVVKAWWCRKNNLG